MADDDGGEFFELFVENELEEQGDEFRRSFDLGATDKFDKLEGQYRLLFKIIMNYLQF